MVCPSPRLREERRRRREERRRRREDLPAATEEALAGIAAAARRRPGSANRGRTLKALGREANRRRVARHFDVAVRDDGMDWARNAGRIAAEARLDGIHVIRTSLDTEAIGTGAAVDAYRSLAGMERAFRNDRTDLRIRPVYVCTADHVRAHVFLCMLALHVEWHMRRRLAPMLSGDGDRAGARAQRGSPVERAGVPESAKAKAGTKRTPDGLPVHSLRTLPGDLGTLTLNEVTLPGAPDHAFPLLATPTELQRRAFRLLEIDPARDVAM